MKNTILILLLLPFISFGQSDINLKKSGNRYDVYKGDTLMGSLKNKYNIPLLRFEISEMVGYSKELSSVFNQNGQNNSGFSNQFSFNYYFTNHFSLGAIYELNLWQTHNYSFGIVPEFYFNKIYFGVSFCEFVANSIKAHYFVIDNETFNTSLSYGAHFGITQRLLKHFTIKEQANFTFCNLSSYPHRNEDIFIQSLNYISIFVGVSYKL